LPYLEENAVHDLNTTAQIESTPINMYFCPSRRQPTQYPATQRWLMDYAALTAAPSRSHLGNNLFDALINQNRGCTRAYSFWGTPSYSNDFNPRTKEQLGNRYTGYWGIIVRSSYLVAADGSVTDLNYDPITTIRRVKDGLSKTAMISEKYIPTGVTGAAYDDRGWSDGWDLDTMSSSLCQPTSDRTRLSWPAEAITAGSAHPSGINVVYADGSVRFISYDINLEIFNRIAHRSDGELVDSDSY
jgi:prepilin-type processing-associated H-X9-DG protein